MKTYKTSFNLLALMFLCAVWACKPEIKKLPDNAIDQSEIETAKTFANDYFNAMMQEEEYQFPEIVSAEMQENITAETMNDNFGEIMTEFGTFQSMKYMNTWVTSQSPDLKILRFKGSFSKIHHPVELRIAIDENKQIAGFEIKKWKDELI